MQGEASQTAVKPFGSPSTVQVTSVTSAAKSKFGFGIGIGTPGIEIGSPKEEVLKSEVAGITKVKTCPAYASPKVPPGRAYPPAGVKF